MEKYLIICGNLSVGSNTFEISKFLCENLNSEFWYLKQNENIPLLEEGLLANSFFPECLLTLIKKIECHQKIIFVTPQYNLNFSGFFKNIIDWLSIQNRKFLNNKYIVLVSVNKRNTKSHEFETIANLTLKSFGLKFFYFIDWPIQEQKNDLLKKILNLNE